ncbi:DUF4365 domain-containing protein [Sporosarcina sp. P33]|uniref:DUF4365 domain-containing protein n=1 Tax=Sporosarcina sp. P33 TaxID=1930764 RepID=UPI0009C3DC29|nr:DUF4365 domain-containing protein [Sporosarcina sp. P33]ARD47106.1 hypothetical protein SporoP33_01840 [Sporosarcina sp. P33]
MKRSQYDEKSINEGKSRRFFEGVIEENGWKYRVQDKDNDIDGEIEVFSKEGETTAKIVKVQLKSTTSLKMAEKLITFDCPVKFLNFCDVCDIPVIIVLYDVKEKKAYWLWTQQYIFKVLDKNNESWRNNTSSVTIKIPIENEVLEDSKFYNEIKGISINGINEIQQWRKHDTSEYYFTILEEKDDSNINKRRISAKIYIERSFATSRNSTIELIKKINAKIKINKYNKRILQGRSVDSEPDYVWLSFYDDLIQFEYGLPFCRTEWINGKDSPPLFIKEYDQLIDENNIRVKWEYNRPLQDYLLLNSTSKTHYLEGVRESLVFAKSELALLPKLFAEEDNSNFYNHIKAKQKEYSRNFILLSDFIPPHECKPLHRALEAALGELDNLAMIIEGNERNKQYINYQFVSKFYKHLVILNYEIDKII